VRDEDFWYEEEEEKGGGEEGKRDYIDGCETRQEGT